MPYTPSMLPIDPAIFSDAAIPEETKALNAKLIELLTPAPEWWDIVKTQLTEFVK